MVNIAVFFLELLTLSFLIAPWRVYCHKQRTSADVLIGFIIPSIIIDGLCIFVTLLPHSCGITALSVMSIVGCWALVVFKIYSFVRFNIRRKKNILSSANNDSDTQDNISGATADNKDNPTDNNKDKPDKPTDNINNSNTTANTESNSTTDNNDNINSVFEDGEKRGFENGQSCTAVHMCQQFGKTQAETVNYLMQEFGMTEEQAVSAIKQYWQN